MFKIPRYSLALILIFSVSLVHATTVRVINLPEMVSLADRVFLGKCLAVESDSDSRPGLPAVTYTFQVLEGIKGVQSGQTIRFRQIRTGTARQMGIPGLPSYSPGEKALLFLHADSRLGLTSPVGTAQGLFHNKVVSATQAGYVNALKNQNLLYGLSVDSARQSGLTQEDYERLQEGAPIPLSLFSALVQRIERFQSSGGRSTR